MFTLPWIALAALLAQAPGQQAAPNAGQATTEKKGTISGIALNAMTKEPLRRAEITLMPMGQVGGRGGAGSGGGAVMQGFQGPEGPAGTRRVQADAEGKYVFTDVTPGRYMVMARRTGFIDGRYGARKPGSPGTQLDVAADQSLNNVKIELTPQAIIAGRVVDEEGEPFQGAQIQVVRQQFVRGSRRGIPMGGQATNDRGEFRIANVAPGTVYLQVTPARGMGGPSGVTEDKPDLAYVNTYYPGTTDAAQASKIDVTAGSELTGFEIKLQKTRVFRVKGKVVDDSTGQPARGFFVNLVPREAAFFGMFGQGFNRGNDGTFELRGVAPGSYLLNVQTGMGPGSAGNSGRPRMGHSEPLDVTNGHINDLVVHIPPPVKITGSVAANVSGANSFDATSIRLMLMPAGQEAMGARPLTPNEDGTFESDLMSPGKYRVQLLGGNATYWVESIKYGDQDVMGQEFEISSGPAPLRIVLAGDGGTVTGTVTLNDQPASSASVLLIPQDKNRRGMGMGGVRQAETNQSASFTISNIAPGKYWLIALDQFEQGSGDDEEQLRKIEAKATTVEVKKQGNETITLKLLSMTD